MRVALVALALLVSACAPAARTPAPTFDPIAAHAPELVEPPEEAASLAPLVPVASASPGLVRVPRPFVPSGPRRIGLQAGHWLTEEAPAELRRLQNQTGASWQGITEWSVNLDVANRAAVLLRADGYAVDVLPTTVPAGYLADVFLALHADSDGAGATRGFKVTHGLRRGPFEDVLVRAIREEYASATGLPQDDRTSRSMTFYYAFTWTRYRSSVAPHTPAAILEMGFLSHDADRTLLVERPDVVARGVADAIRRFLREVPSSKLFGEDLVLPAGFGPVPPFR